MKDPQEKRLNEILRLMETDDSTDAPAESIKWAKNLFLTRQAQPSLIKRIVASLQMDLKPGTAAFGERSATMTGTARQMLFNAGEHAIDIRVDAENSHVNVRGQVLGEGFDAGIARLSGSDLERTSDITSLSEFTFENVPKGYYTLTLRSTTREIVIEDVDL